MTDDDAFARFVFDDVQPEYTQQQPMTLDEINALLAGIESHKQRLIVPTERVAEFEDAVRAANLGHAVAVVGHAWLKPDQVLLAASEAQLEDDMRAAMSRAVTESFELLRAQTAAAPDIARAYLDEQAREEFLREFERRPKPWPGSPLIEPPGI